MKPYAHPWKPCSCPECKGNKRPAHAHIEVECSETKDRFTLRVPHEHRHDHTGWGKRPHVRWKTEEGEDLRGLEMARGNRGVTAIDHTGKIHRLDHGYFTEHGHDPKDLGERVLDMRRLAKAKAKLKPGQRWITVHSHEDGKGTPILISDNKDGSWSVVAGAGGKLSHLKLTNVKSPEEHEAAAKEKRAEKATAEKERKAKQTTADAEAEKAKKGDVEANVKLAERNFINQVRDQLGGVAENLDESKLAGLSDGSKNLILTRHHQKQLRQAKARLADAAKEIVDRQTEHERHKAAISDSVDPVAREMAMDALHAAEVEEEERRAERRQKRTRNVGRKTGVGEKAKVAELEFIEAAPDPTKDLELRGGRDDDPKKILNLMNEPAAELERRSFQAQQDAKILASVATGEQPDDAIAAAVVEKAKQRMRLEKDAPPEDVQEACAREAARQWRRSEQLQARAEKMHKIQMDDGMETAYRALAWTDMAASFGKTASEAKKLGLTDANTVPVSEFTADEIKAALSSEVELRKARKEYQAMVKEAESGDYDRSRTAMPVKVSASPQEVEMSIEDEVRRNLAEGLRGMAARKRTPFLQSVSAGHYDAMADAGLSIGGNRYVDRLVMDALGPANSARLMRHAMEQDGHDPKNVLKALEEVHVERINKVAADAMNRADKVVPEFSAQVKDVDDIETAMAQLGLTERQVEEVQQTVGTALGNLEGMATLAQAMREKEGPKQLTVHFAEAGGLDTNLQWLHSLGLTPKDYAVHHKDGDIVIAKRGFDKLLAKEDSKTVEQRQRAEAIKAGDEDEKGWLPSGIKRRAATTFTAPVPDSPTWFEPMRFDTGNVSEAVADHIGSRLAEGEHPADIQADLLSPEIAKSAPDLKAYTAAVLEHLPIHDEKGEVVKHDAMRETHDALAARYMRKKYGDETGAFHAQDVNPEHPDTQEAMFRALAEHPNAKVAFKPLGELTHEDRSTLRDHFYQRQGIDPKKKVDEAAFAAEMAALGPEPEGRDAQAGLFGGFAHTGEYQAWVKRRDSILSRHPRAGMDEAIKALGSNPPADKVEAIKQAAVDAPTEWGKYVEAHGSLQLAQQALQDELKGAFLQSFAEHHGKISGKGLVTGQREITNSDRHLKAVAGRDEREAMIADARSKYAQLHQRMGGQFASMGGEGSLKERYGKWLEQQVIQRQNQLGLFGAGNTGRVDHKRGKSDIQPGSRFSLGERAENQIGSVMGRVGAQFEPGKKTDLFPGLNMDGPRVHQQRVIKQMRANGGRIGAFLGTGSGKSLTSIGAATDHIDSGDAKHAVFLVPPAVQQQFGQEMLKFTEPGKYKWSTGAGKGHAERMEMLRDPGTHMKVMTHESFRDSMLQAMADHHRDGDRAKMREDLESVDAKTRAGWLREAMEANGIPPWFIYSDEAHKQTAREGAGPSSINLVATAATHPDNSSQAMIGTATPIKNDTSELYSMASMLDPERYADRSQFMHNFGSMAGVHPHAIRRELSHLTYSAKIPPTGVERHDSDNPRIVDGKKVGQSGPVVIGKEHRERVNRVDALYDRAKRARDAGLVDVEAVKELSPGRFQGIPSSKHERIARELQDSIGIVRESAMKRAINQAPADQNEKLQRLGDVVKHDLERGEYRRSDGTTGKGKPSIIFSNSLKDVNLIHEHLQSQGIRSVTYHGGLDHKQREDVRRGFQPSKGESPKYDVIVATRSAQEGINAQRAKVIHHYDVPDTSMSHEQRSGRAYRQGQEGDVDVHNWSTDTDFDARSLQTLRRKADLAQMFESETPALDETGIAAAYQKQIAQRRQRASA